jgi:hypothetical protein
MEQLARQNFRGQPYQTAALVAQIYSWQTPLYLDEPFTVHRYYYFGREFLG